MPRDLEETIDVWAELHDVDSFSEAVRQLVVRSLEADGMRLTVTDETGTYVDEKWKQPLGEDL